jgi:hypothetical protein
MLVSSRQLHTREKRSKFTEKNRKPLIGLVPRDGTEIDNKTPRILVFLDSDIVGYPQKYPRKKAAAAGCCRMSFMSIRLALSKSANPHLVHRR